MSAPQFRWLVLCVLFSAKGSLYAFLHTVNPSVIYQIAGVTVIGISVGCFICFLLACIGYFSASTAKHAP